MPDPKNRPYIEPTRSDSLDVLRNSQAVNDFYIGQNYLKNGLNTPAHEGIFNALDEKYKDFVDKYKKGIQTYNTSGGSSIGEAYEPRFYRKNVDENKFYQRERADNVINFEAPMALYNRNIMPHHLNYYKKNMGTVGDDNVSIPMYDILATTPADMLTDEQLIKRVQVFGSTSIPNSRLRKLGLPLNEDTPSASSLKRKKERDTIDRQLKEAGLYNRAEGITGRNPDASRMYEEYMRSKQPSQSSVPQVPNQVQSAGEAIKQPIEEIIPEGYQINRGYTRDGVTYGDVYNPTTAQGKTYPIPGSPTMEDYERLYGKGSSNNSKKTGTRFVRADFAAGGVPPTEPPTEPPTGPAPTRSDSVALYNNALAKAAFYEGLDTKYDIIEGETDFLNSKNRNNIINSLEESARFVDSPILNKEFTITQDQIDAFNVSNSYLDEKRFKKVPGTNLTSFGDIRRDDVDRWFNPAAPPILLHPNISPQGSQTYKSKEDSGFGDTTDVPYYDPIAVAPWPTLTPEEQKERLDKYGTTGTPLDTGTTEKPRSESSLKREEARNILKKEMDTLGFTGYSAREVSKKGSEAEKAYQKHLGNYTETTAVETPKVVETPTKPEVTKPKVTLPKGYSYTQHESRDGDMNDYFFTNKNGSKKRISREDFIKNTNYSPTQFRERHVEIPEFRDGGPINPVKITLPDGSVKEVARDSDEYKQAYDQGNIMTKFGEDSYVAPELDEFTVTSETDKERRDAYLARAGKHFAEENLLTKYWDTKKKFQDLGKGALETVGKVASIPQAIGVMDFKRQIGQGPENFNEFKDAAWNKQETPSDVIDSFGPNNMTDAARFALDFGMDPMWLMGSGIGKGSGALANLSSKGLDKGLKGAKGVKNALGKTVNSSITPIANASKNQLKGAANWINDAGIVGKEASAYVKDFFKKDLKKKLDKGNDFVKDWANHPATQEKLIKEHNKFVDNVDDFLPPVPISKADANIMREKLISIGESRLKEQLKAPAGVNFYPIKNQIKDLFTGKPNIHRGNLGVSYPKQPYTKEYIKEQAKSFSPTEVKDWNTAIERQGDWVSRNAPDIESTSIHEGTHGWTDGNKLLNKKDEDLFNTMLNKESLESSKNYHDFPRDSKEWGLGYYGDPTEQHARIMELRNFYNLSPTQKISTKQASKMLEDISKSKSNIHTFSDNFAITNKTKSRKMPVDQEWLNSYKTDPKEAKKFADLFNDVRTIAPLVGAGSLGAASQKAYGGPINNDGPLAKSQGDIYLPLDGTRPSYIDASGKERSEYKIGVGTKEGEMVIPTVWNGEQHTEDEAIDRYYNTGEHMGGPYGSIEEGERAAKLRTFLYNEHPAYRKKAYGGCAPKYAQGGQLYEAEGGEVIDGGNPITLQGGHISPNSSNSGKIVGNSHGNGGVKMTGGEKIYSDRLTVDASFLKDLDI